MNRRVHIALALAMLAVPAVHAQPLGRLFTTPAERHQLDQARAAARAPAAPVAAGQPAAAPAAPAEPVTVHGFVRRSSGRSTVWVNAAEQEDARNRFSGPARKSAVIVRLPSGRTIEIKPGQTADPDQGGVRDVHQK